MVIQLPDDTACDEWKIVTELRQTVQNILAKKPFQMEVRKWDAISGTVQSSRILVE